MSINEELVRIQKGLAVPKGQKNEFGNYAYRSAEDILHAVKGLLVDHSVIIDTDIITVADRVYVKATAILRGEADSLSARGYAREPLSRKGMDESQITGAATSYAKKYALGNLFAIDNEKDADTMDNSQQGQGYTEEQYKLFLSALEADNGLKMLTLSKTLGSDVFTSLAASGAKGDKVKLRTKVNDLIINGGEILEDYVEQIIGFSDIDDSEGFNELISELNDAEKKLISKALPPQVLTTIKRWKNES